MRAPATTALVSLLLAFSAAAQVDQQARHSATQAQETATFALTVARRATATGAGTGICPAHNWASTLNAGVGPTCTRPAFSDISGTVTNSQLASSYSGVGTCSTHQWASVLAANAAPTCTQPAFTDLSGSPLAGGGSPQLQYNNGGVLGGTAHVNSDGTHELYIAETTPSAPSANSLAFDLTGPPVPTPSRIDAFMKLPIPVGLFRSGTFALLGTTATWKLCVNYASAWNSTSLDVGDGCLNTALTTEGSTASGGGWAATSFTTRQRRVGFTTSSNSQFVGAHRGVANVWVGNSAGIGGFLFWSRVFSATRATTDALFVGVAALTSAFVTGTKPSGQVNSMYVGCDASDTNLSVCSDDTTAPATCTSLGSSFPCHTAGTAYDVFLAVPPNGLLPDAGTGFGYYVERLDSAANTAGTVSTDLPSNSIQLGAHVSLSGPDAGLQTVKLEIGVIGDLANW